MEGVCSASQVRHVAATMGSCQGDAMGSWASGGGLGSLVGRRSLAAPSAAMMGTVVHGIHGHP
jgi:hypothetical protein